MPDAAAKVARFTGRLGRQEVADPRITVSYPTVTAVVSTNPTVVKTNQTGEVEVTGLGSYDPVVDDRVAVATVDGSPILLGTTGTVPPPYAPTRKRGTTGATIATGDTTATGSVSFTGTVFTAAPWVGLTVLSGVNCAVRLTGTPTTGGFGFAVFRTDASPAPSNQSITVMWWADV